MKRQILVALLAAAMVIGGVSAAHADNIGFLDMERLFAGFKEGKDVQLDLQKRREEFQKIFDEKQKTVEQARKDKKSDEDVQKMVNAIQTELTPQRDVLVQHESEAQAVILGKIREVTRQVAKRNGVDVVLDRRAVYAGGFDLTDFVIEKLNGGGSTAPAKKSAKK